jgi:hypothetical protein
MTIVVNSDSGNDRPANAYLSSRLLRSRSGRFVVLALSARVGDTSDFTQATVVRDSRELTYAWRTYADQRMRQVNLKELIEVAKTPVRIVITPVTGDDSSIEDVTGQLIDSAAATA